MSKKLQFFDGMDMWKGYDSMLNTATTVDRPVRNSPWMIDTYFETMPLYNLTYSFGANCIPYETKLGDMFDAGRLKVDNYMYNLVLSMPWVEKNGGAKHSGQPNDSIQVRSMAYGLVVEVAADIADKFYPGYGGTIFSINVGTDIGDAQNNALNLHAKWDHVNQQVVFNVHTFPNGQPNYSQLVQTRATEYIGGPTNHYSFGVVNNESGSAAYALGQDSLGLGFRRWAYNFKDFSPAGTADVTTPGTPGLLVSATRVQLGVAHYYYVMTNTAPGGGGWPAGQLVYYYDSAWNYVGYYDLNSKGMVEPVGLCYDPRSDSIYVLDHTGVGTYKMYVFSSNFATLISSSGTLNFNDNGPNSNNICDICMNMGTDNYTGDVSYGHEMRDYGVLVLGLSATFQAFWHVKHYEGGDAFAVSPVASHYNQYFEDDAIQGKNRGVLHDGFYIWMFDDISLTGDFLTMRRIQGAGPECFATDYGAGIGVDSAAATAAPGSTNYLCVVHQPDAFNTVKADMQLWLNGVNVHRNASKSYLSGKTAGGDGLNTLRLHLNYYAGWEGTVAYIDDFWCQTSVDDDEDWNNDDPLTLEAGFPTAWKIHTLTPRITQGNFEAKNQATQKACIDTSDNTYREEAGYLRGWNGGQQHVRFDRNVPITGTILGVMAGMGYSRDDEDPETSDYPSPDHNIILEYGLGVQGTTAYWQYTSDYVDPTSTTTYANNQVNNLRRYSVAGLTDSQRQTQHIYEQNPQSAADWTLGMVTTLQLNMRSYDKT